MTVYAPTHASIRTTHASALADVGLSLDPKGKRALGRGGMHY